MVKPVNSASETQPGKSPQGEAPDSWDRIAGELRACKEFQKKAWGDVDNSTLGRYLAGEVADEERGTIERALESHPELRQLTDLVRDVLGGLEPLAEATPAAPAPAPTLLSFEQARAARPSRRRVLPFLRRHGALLAAACLLVALCGVTPLAGPRPDARRAAGPPPAFLGDALARSSATSPASVFTSVMSPAPGEIASDGPPRPAFLAEPALPPPAPLSSDRSEKKSAPLAVASAAATPVGITARDAAHGQRRARHSLREGDVVDAERSLAVSYLYCQKRLGPRHPFTTQTAQQLADLYAPALNDDRGMQPLVRMAPASPVKDGENFRAGAFDRREVSRLREQIHNQTLAEVQATVVPALARALQTAATPDERQALVRALGQLGAAAGPARPALEKCLAQAVPAEQRLILFTLGRIGPSAMPALAQVANDDRPRLSPENRDLARTILQKLHTPEAQAGVADAANCLPFRHIRTASMQIRQLARDLGVIVLLETRAGAPSAPETLARRRQLGKHGVYVLIDVAGPAVEVHACPLIEKAGFSADAVRAGVLDPVNKKQFPQACDAALRLIREQARQMKSARP